eukprot:TRINITY_DN44099_c0_g1_i1.p1 TRINITY_DN44099_c0_g1~~TRINITY_DN44099_c0_g1_i1.p1  ORF type:complete len:852 (+),score=139.59 TRINITY_DN44099_c0_g1_i1:98-2557(+)
MAEAKTEITVLEDEFLSQLKGRKLVEEDKIAFKHGLIEFDNSHRAKYLVVPEGMDDSLRLLEVVCSLWNLTLPKLLLELEGGTDTRQSWFHHLMQPDLWDKNPAVAEQLFNHKTDQVIKAIVAACGECDAWIDGGLCSISYGGAGEWYQSRFEAMGQGIIDYSKSSYDATEVKMFCERFAGPGLFGSESLLSKAVPINEQPSERVLYPDMRSRYMSQGKVLTWKGERDSRPFPENVVQPFCTHMLIWQDRRDWLRASLLDNLKKLVPRVTLILEGHHPICSWAAIERASKHQVIVLRNTGGAADVLAEAVSRRQRALRDGSVVEPVEYAYAGTWLEDPNELQDSFVVPSHIDVSKFTVVNVFTDSTDQIVDQVIQSMAMENDVENLALGNQSAEKQRLLQAFGFYCVWKHNAEYHGRLSIVLQYVVLSITMLTTLTSVLYIQLNSSHEVGYLHVLALAVALLPLVSGGLLAMNNQFRPLLKWAQLDSAAVAVLSEIYRFRTRTGDYRARKSKLFTVGGQKGDASDDKARTTDSAVQGTTNDTQKKRLVDDTDKAPDEQVMATTRRGTFVAAISALHTELLQGEMKLDSLKVLPDDAVQKELQKISSKRRLMSPKKTSSEPRKVRPSGFLQQPLICEPGDEESQQNNEGVDDGISILSAEQYIAVRVQPMLSDFKRRAPWLNRALCCAQSLTVLLTTMNAALATLQGQAWIPVVVSVISSLQSLMDFHLIQARLQAVNKAAKTLQNLLIWWEGLSLVEKRYPENKENLVQTCESVVSAEQVWPGQGSVGKLSFGKQPADGAGGKDDAREAKECKEKKQRT